MRMIPTVISFPERAQKIRCGTKVAVSRGPNHAGLVSLRSAQVGSTAKKRNTKREPKVLECISSPRQR